MLTVRYRGRMKGHGQPGLHCTRTFWVTFLISAVCVCLMLSVVFSQSNRRVAMGLLAAAGTITALSLLKLLHEKIVACRKRRHRDVEVQTCSDAAVESEPPDAVSV